MLRTIANLTLPVSVSVLTATTIMPRAAVDQDAIRREYGTPGTTARSLAQQWGISERTVYRIVGRHPESGPQEPLSSRVRARNEPAPLPPPDAPRAKYAPSGRKEEGIVRIKAEMTRGAWHSGLWETLGAEYGVSPHTVRAWAHEAAIELRVPVDRDRVVSRLEQSLEFLAHEAYAAKEVGDTKSALLAMSRLGALCAQVLRRGDLFARPGVPGAPESLSDDELIRAANRIAQRGETEDENETDISDTEAGK